MPRLTYANVVASIALFASVGGGAAVAADYLSPGDQPINACAGGRGELTYLEPGDHCGQNAKMLTWNKQGPKGDTGPQGPQGVPGPKGAQGLTGPSNVHALNVAPQAKITKFAKNYGKLTLPAGDYFFMAKGQAGTSNSSEDILVKCTLRLTDPWNNIDIDEVKMDVDPGGPYEVPFSLTASQKIQGAGGSVALRCHDDDSGGGWMDDVKLVAIRTGSLDIQKWPN